MTAITTMSASTPAASSSGGVSPTNASAPDVTQSVNSIDRLVLEYLRSRGHKDAEKALNESIESSVDESVKTVSAEELIKSLAVYAQKSSRPGDNVLKESANVLQELTAMGNPPSIHNLIASLGTVGAEDILSVDPTDKEEGFRELEAWVEGSLDMYKVLREYSIRHRCRLILCNSPNFDLLCFPYSVTSIWILCSEGSRKLVCMDCFIQHIFNHLFLHLLALRFHDTYSPSLAPMHHATLHHLSTLLLPSHVQNDDLAQRFKNEKYVIRMSRSGFSLLVGWLTEGIGGEASGAGEGFSGEKGKRGRAAIMRVVNNHLRFDGKFLAFRANAYSSSI